MKKIKRVVFLEFSFFLISGWVCFHRYLQHLETETFVSHGICNIPVLQVSILHAICASIYFACYLQHLGAGTFISHGICSISQFQVCFLQGICAMLKLQACILYDMHDFGSANWHFGWRL